MKQPAGSAALSHPQLKLGSMATAWETLQWAFALGIQAACFGVPAITLQTSESLGVWGDGLIDQFIGQVLFYFVFVFFFIEREFS